MPATRLVAEPDFNAGIDYWKTQPANLDGVLGGFGSGTLPRVDATGSRQFAQYLIPTLCKVPSAVRPLNPRPVTHRTRALDVGAGVGRVTQHVLLHLFDDVVLLEPVEHFVRAAYQNCLDAVDPSPDMPFMTLWKGIPEKTASVTFLQGGLQSFDPLHPAQNTTAIGRLGYDGPTEPLFDIIWCQWCLGHLSDGDLVSFFKRAQGALRSPPDGLIVVKENLCSDGPNGEPRTIFDEQDSSLTRSGAAWLERFKEAGLRLVRQQTQQGFPAGLYEVKMYALRPA